MRYRSLLVGTMVLAGTATTALLLPRVIWAAKADAKGEKPGPGPLGCAICFVPEMVGLPDGYRWQSVNGDRKSALAAGFDPQWAKIHPAVERYCTAELAVALSRWARPQMQTYKGPPALKGLKFKALSIDKEKNVALLEATVERLPSHHRIVVRWLKLYAYYDVGSKTIPQVTITIRGQVYE